MSRKEGKLVRLADHPRFRTRKKDPELVMVGPGEYLTREEYNDLLPPDQEYEEIDYGEDPLDGLAVCTDCVHAVDFRARWRQWLGHPPTTSEMRCDLKGLRCDSANPRNDCNEFIIALVEE